MRHSSFLFFPECEREGGIASDPEWNAVQRRNRQSERRTRMCRKPRRRPKKRGRRFGVTAQKTRGIMGTLSFAKHLGFPSFVSRETEEPITEPDITLIMVVMSPRFIGEIYCKYAGSYGVIERPTNGVLVWKEREETESGSASISWKRRRCQYRRPLAASNV